MIRRAAITMADLSTGFRIRQALAEDHPALMSVCLLTGDSGADGTALHDDPEILGMVYAVPYQVFAPRLAFVLEDSEGVCGYAFGVPDTAAFDLWMDEVWYPPLRARLRNPGADPARWRQSDWVRWRVFAPRSAVPVDPGQYPAHVHIDLLPRAQGRGLGRAMMENVLSALASEGVAGTFLEVGRHNKRAQDFYRHLGFEAAVAGDEAVIMVKSLRQKGPLQGSFPKDRHKPTEQNQS